MEEPSRTVNTITEQQKQQIEGLVQELNEASRVYYNGQEEIMPNYRWDELFDQLKALEEETGYVLPDSPWPRPKVWKSLSSGPGIERYGYPGSWMGLLWF